jgi:hypothetical protein
MINPLYEQLPTSPRSILLQLYLEKIPRASYYAVREREQSNSISALYVCICSLRANLNIVFKYIQKCKWALNTLWAVCRHLAAHSASVLYLPSNELSVFKLGRVASPRSVEILFKTTCVQERIIDLGWRFAREKLKTSRF